MTLYWIHTSDVHGSLDTLRGIEAHIQQLRHNDPALVILTDGGDMLQGHPICYYYNHIDTITKHPVAETINRMRYDAIAVGNHDIEIGHHVFNRVFKDINCPILCANIKNHFQPYHIIEKGGLRIAVLSLLTRDTTHWVSPSQYEGMEFEDEINSAQHWIKHIKDIEHPDLLVGLFHIGWKDTKLIAESIQDFDLILYGHDHHNAIHQVGRTICAAPSSGATTFVEVTIDIDSRSIKSANTFNSYISEEPTFSSASTDATIQFNTTYHKWLNEPIGTISTDLVESDSYFGPSSFLTLTHQLQLAATEAQISFAAPISYDSIIQKGTLTNRDIFTLYNRDSQLNILRLSTEDIKDILEYSYSLWTSLMKSSDDHALLLAPLLDNGTRLCLKHSTSNFLTAYGIDYTVNLTKPIGEKVRLVLPSAFTLHKEHHWTCCLNSYHTHSLPFNLQSKVIRTLPDLRLALTEQIRKIGNINPQPATNWRFLPETLTSTALERDRNILFPQT